MIVDLMSTTAIKIKKQLQTSATNKQITKNRVFAGSSLPPISSPDLVQYSPETPGFSKCILCRLRILRAPRPYSKSLLALYSRYPESQRRDSLPLISTVRSSNTAPKAGVNYNCQRKEDELVVIFLFYFVFGENSSLLFYQ